MKLTITGQIDGKSVPITIPIEKVIEAFWPYATKPSALSVSNEFEFLLKKNGFALYKKYENYYKQGIVEYAFNGLLPEKQNDCRLSQNVV